MQFKEGDRVRVYATLIGMIAESKGTVLATEYIDSKLRLKVRLDTNPSSSNSIYAHPKQCRKLKTKAKPVGGKPIWVPKCWAVLKKIQISPNYESLQIYLEQEPSISIEDFIKYVTA